MSRQSMNRQSIFDVVIIGAGVVGSAAALGLVRQGLRVALVEVNTPTTWRAEQPDLRVYAIAPDSQLLLDSLGVWGSIRSARVQPYRRMNVWDAGATGELCFDADAFGVEALGHIVEHGLLVDRLWAALVSEPGVERYCPDKLHRIDQDKNCALVELESGICLRAHLVLGADGANSRVRKLSGLSSSEHDYRQHALVAYVRTQLPHREACWQRFLPGGPLAFLPCSDKGMLSSKNGHENGYESNWESQCRSSIVWSLPEEDAARLVALEESAFRQELTRAFDARLGEVLEVSERVTFPLKRRLASDMLVGRIALIGDAAHVVHPLAGQGVNLGLRDVTSLCAVLRKSLRSSSDFSEFCSVNSHHLQRWVRQCRSDNTVSAYAYETINALFSNDRVLPTLLRGHALGLIGKLPPLTQFFWKQAAGLSNKY